MGQNNSSYGQTRSAPATPRGRGEEVGRGRSGPPGPPPQPSPPPGPKPHEVPENLVLPMGAGGELPSKRQLLRPVSQELSKFHPEYATIFKYPAPGETPAPQSGGRLPDGKENELVLNGTGARLSDVTSNGDLPRSHSLQDMRPNGHGPAPVSGHPAGSDVTEGERGRSMQRTNSLDRRSVPGGAGNIASRAPAGGHKRYPSAAASVGNDVIEEDPREHLYSHWRQDPYSNLLPVGMTSLPLKSTFDLDYKMNLTYAQLADHRRQQRTAELEDKTGQKLAELSADLKDKSSLPVSPFDRYHYSPSQPSSSASSDTGVSKSKKRRAPPPPGTVPPRDYSPGRLSLDSEPPADYDLDDSSPSSLENSTASWKRPVNVSRKSSSASLMSKTSKSSKGPAPPPPLAASLPSAIPQAPTAPALHPSAVLTMRAIAEGPGKPGPAVVSASVTSLAAAGTLAATKPKAGLPETGQLPSRTATALSSETARLVAQAQAELEALKKLEAIMKEKDQKNKSLGDEEKAETLREGLTSAAKEAKDLGTSEKDNSVDEDQVQTVPGVQPRQEKEAGKESPMSASTSSLDDVQSGQAMTTLTTTTTIQDDPPQPPASPSPEKPQDSADGKTNAAPRLSSLLQHDIALAAQARASKVQLKSKTPAQLERPKDSAEMFREELAKAAVAREQRAKSAAQLRASKQDESGAASDKDEDGSAVVFKSDLVKVKRRPVSSDTISSTDANTTTPTTLGAVNTGPFGAKTPPPVSPKPLTSISSTEASSKIFSSQSEPDILLRARNEALSGTYHSGNSPPRQRPPQGFDEDGDPVIRKSASHDAVFDHSKPKHSATSPSSSVSAPETPRQFGDDWKPEDDLDSDDDIHDEFGTFSRNAAALAASGNFGSSAGPGKMKDLKKPRSKASTLSSSSGSRRESGSSSTDERHKFGSLRKFQKSVNQSVRNAFGSISKASGRILSRKHKSHDLEAEEGGPVAVTEVRRVSSERDEDPSLLPDREIPVPSVGGVNPHSHNGHLSLGDSDSSDDHSGDEEKQGVASLNDVRESSSPAGSGKGQLRPEHQQQQQQQQTGARRKMKRAGVAYVGQKGQLIVLPEFETVEVDEQGRVVQDERRRTRRSQGHEDDEDDEEGRAPRIYRKKKKKFTYESTVRRLENGLVAEHYNEEIRNKEREMQYERLRQQEQERQFQRLRDLETQERLSRLQAAQHHHQMVIMQQQHQQRPMQPGPPAPPPGPDPRYGLPDYTPVSGGSYYPSPATAGAPGMPAQVGPGVAVGATASYDVQGLLEYLRLMGAQPPTTQQQWAYLLTGVAGGGMALGAGSGGGGGFGGGGVTANGGVASPPPLASTASILPKNPGVVTGPDLSHLFGPAGSAGSVQQHPHPYPYSDPATRLAAFTAPTLSVVPDPGVLAQRGFIVGAADPGMTHAAVTDSRASNGQSSFVAAASQPPEPRLNGGGRPEGKNPMYCSSDDDDDDDDDPDENNHHDKTPVAKSSVSRAKSDSEQRITSGSVPGLLHQTMSVNGGEATVGQSAPDRGRVPNGGTAYSSEGVGSRKGGATSQQVNGEQGNNRFGDGGGGFRTVEFQRSRPSVTGQGQGRLPLSPRVYGPVGYRPVAFSPPISPRFPAQGEDRLDR